MALHTNVPVQLHIPLHVYYNQTVYRNLFPKIFGSNLCNENLKNGVAVATPTRPLTLTSSEIIIFFQMKIKKFKFSRNLTIALTSSMY